MRRFRLFVSAFLAGVVFSFGCAAYLQLESSSKIIAALMFSIGLIAVLTFKLDLFTAKAGYLFTESTKSLGARVSKLCLILLGNVLGAAAVGAVLGYFTDIQPLKASAASVVTDKMAESPLSIFVGSFFCGMLMFIAVHGYRRHTGNFAGCLVAVLSVFAFVICGFEHCISDVFYLAVAGCDKLNALMLLLVSAIGNFVGAVVFSELYELKKGDSEDRYRHHHSHNS